MGYPGERENLFVGEPNGELSGSTERVSVKISDIII